MIKTAQTADTVQLQSQPQLQLQFPPQPPICATCLACLTCPVWIQNQDLVAENTNLGNHAKELEIQNQALKRRLEHYENIHNHNQTPPLRRLRRRKKTLTRYPGRPRGYSGTTRPRPPKPDKIIPAQEVESCPECGSHLGKPIYTKQRIVEELPGLEPVKILGYRENHYLCPECDCKIVARHPDCPPQGVFGKNVYIQTTLHKFEERLPLRRITKVFNRQGLDLTQATALDLLHRTARWLRPEYDTILAQVRMSDVVYTDQTPLKVDGKPYWIWDFLTDTETLYVVRPTKGRKVLEEILGKSWPGILVCDGLRSHHSFTHNIQRCWAHILKDADELAEAAEAAELAEGEEVEVEEGPQSKQHRTEAEALRSGLHSIYDRLKTATARKPPPRKRERERLTRNGRAALRYWLGKKYTDPGVSRLVEKIKRAYPYLFEAVNHPGVELTNNRSERGLRELVVQRKIIGTLRNSKGTYIYETLATLLATWEKRGLDPAQALSTALTQNWQNTNHQTS